MWTSIPTIRAVNNGGAGAGWKTDWVFTDGVGTGLACGQAAAHENGHGLSLCHQSDYTGNTLVNEYSLGDDNNANGTYAPIIGAAYYTQRGAWRLGDSDNGRTNHYQNDVAVILSNSGIGGFVDDGIGHTLATATPMPLSGSNVNAAPSERHHYARKHEFAYAYRRLELHYRFFQFHTNGGSDQPYRL